MNDQGLSADPWLTINAYSVIVLLSRGKARTARHKLGALVFQCYGRLSLGSLLQHRLPRLRETALPQPPNRPDQIALERTDRLAPGLAVRLSSSKVGLRWRPGPGLGQRDPIQDGIEPTIAALVQAVADGAS